MSQISFLIDELICDPATSPRQRAELLRVRRRFAVFMLDDGQTLQGAQRPTKSSPA
ncbi:MAG TPA: hypothetical protein VF160_05135 [Candidatus Dormibacteraeota bacterium]